ncbi:GNAT family N-acetyltransferase [Thalassobacillus hwangdonensis]|uniref:GNAT family N-acetyltransferase n=1 Tax=Thalassobacillus hwangdonensis TaxID=546108 RepID=A0ABW3L6Q8_9BACI
MKQLPTFETERLILRDVEEKDLNAMFDYLSDREVVKHMGLAPAVFLEDVRNELDWYTSIKEEGTGMRWGITLKNTDQMIGSCGFLNRAPKHHRAEIGFELSRNHWGRGIASEAIHAVLSYGFQKLGLERVEALIETENLASQNMVERNGFQREGLLRHYEYTLGNFDDLLMYSLLRSEWKHR